MHPLNNPTLLSSLPVREVFRRPARAAMVLALGLAILPLAGCAGQGQQRHPQPAAGVPAQPAARLPVPTGPRKLVAVAGFQNRSTYASDKLWDTSAQMLTTRLVSMNYFRVVEWSRMKELFDHLALSQLDIVKSPEGRNSAAKILLCEYFLTGAVTRFDIGQTARVSALSKGKTYTTTIGVDLLLQDTQTGEFVGAASAEAVEVQQFSGQMLGTWDPASADRALDRAIGEALEKLTLQYHNQAAASAH